MATWLQKNSMLTEKGVEILNKLNIGQGQITLSRIVAGEGSVSDPKMLYEQHSVGGNVIDLEMKDLETDETGTEISFRVSNEDFIESFTIRQIGVYVTHPDYVGEVLYHISQCEEEGADVIPKYEGNLVTLNYSLYLIHGNSDALNIEVDPLDTVTQGEFDSFKTTINNKVEALTTTFNSFKNGLKAGKLVAVDSNGNLIASGKNIVTGESFSVTDAITHRALSLSVEGKSTQSPDPTPSAPVYLVNTKVSYLRNSDGGSTSKLITFSPAIELRSLGNYADTIEWDGAKWWKVQRIQEVVLDGTTNGVYYDGNSSKNYCRLSITSGTLYKQIKDHIFTAPIITSHGNVVGETSELYAFHYSSNGSICGHFLNTVTGVDSSVQTTLQTKCSKVNEWLKAQKDAGKPVKVWYVLKTPVVTEISSTEVLEMYANNTSITCTVEGSTLKPNMRLGYALNTTDDTIMYILKSLARKSEVQVANTFATAELVVEEES